MKSLLKKLRAEKQKRFLERLEKQKTALTYKQFQKLLKMEIPAEKSYEEWVIEWAKKSQEKKEREDKIVSDFLKMVVSKLELDSLPKINECEAIEVPEPVHCEPQPLRFRKPARKISVFKLLSVAAVLVLCLITALPMAIGCGGGDDGGTNSGGQDDGKPYTAWNARVLGQLEGVHFGMVHDAITGREDLIFFSQIISGRNASIELYDDETEELLSYVLYSFVAYDTVGESVVAFTIDYRIRFVKQYEFANYDANYQKLNESEYGFKVGETEIKYLLKTNSGNGEKDESSGEAQVFLCFTYGAFDYFLKITVFEIPDQQNADPSTQKMIAVTPLEEEYIFLMMQSLLLKNNK